MAGVPGASGLASTVFLRLARKAAHILGQQFFLARELGLHGARRYVADEQAARDWAPAARRALYDGIWAEAAERNGAGYRRLEDDFVLLERDGARTIARFHNVQLDDAVTLQLALNKFAIHRLLHDAEVPVPEYRVYTPSDPGAALAFLGNVDASFVVKPASGTSGGFGVTCAVDSIADFRRATRHAARFAEQLMIERTVPGDEYRFLFLDGELLDVIRRRPPHVVGDGRSTIAELLSRENSRRAREGASGGIAFLPTDLDSVLTLDRVGYSLRSRPAVGVVVQAKSSANLNAPAENSTVPLEEVGEEVIEEARRAAAAADLRLSGVDLITPDLSRSLAAAGGAVIEVNGTPGFHYHYLVAEPERATRVAVAVLATLLEEAGRGTARARRRPDAEQAELRRP